LKRELYRKAIHLASVGVPLVVWVLPKGAGLAVLGAAVAAALGVEWARHRVRWVRYHFFRATRTLLRPHERTKLAGATHMVIAYFLALALFPKPIAVVAMLYNGLGDAAAALVGKRWGRHRTAWGKSWEGAGAGLAVNLCVGLVVPGILLPAAISGAFTAALLELLPVPLDDNPRVTLGGGAAAWLVMAALGHPA
jgi:dolichol kinase